MPFLLLLFLTLACLSHNWQPLVGNGSPGLNTAVTWGGVAGAVILAALIAARVRMQLTRNPGRRDHILRRYPSWRLYQTFGLFTAYAIGLYIFGWGATVHRMLSDSISPLVEGGPPNPIPIPGIELFILAPFLIGLVLSWACFYDAERALHGVLLGANSLDTFWSRWAYVSFHIRHNLALVFIPVLLLILQNALRCLLPDEVEDSWIVGSSLVSLLGALLLFACMPWILRFILGLKPLPAGLLRDRLLITAKRLRFRCSGILLWNTHGGVANAMVAGILPFLRYVLLTDRLISDLTPDEVEAVFGHEVGHVKHRHMSYYLGFLLISIAVLCALGMLFEEKVNALGIFLTDDTKPIILVPFLGAYIFLVFGFLSRRCERQADIFGCRAVSCSDPFCLDHGTELQKASGGQTLCPTGIRTFISALEKVALLNGISRDRPGWLQSWQHSTIARRVEFLQRMLADSSVEPRFQRTVFLVKSGLLLGLVALLLLIGVRLWLENPEDFLLYLFKA